MFWIAALTLQFVILLSGVRQLQRVGQWSWSMFAFALGFAALEVLLLTLPIKLGMDNSPYFIRVYVAAWIIAALNFIWFLAVCRRWKPKPRTR